MMLSGSKTKTKMNNSEHPEGTRQCPQIPQSKTDGLSSHPTPRLRSKAMFLVTSGTPSGWEYTYPEGNATPGGRYDN